MALAYRQPGIRITEIVTPQISPLLAAPADLCLIGLTRGYQTRTDQFAFVGTSAIPLPGLPIGSTVTSVVSVKNAIDPTQGQANGSGYTVTTDYTVQASAGTVTRVGAGGIPDGTLVNVTYQYIPDNYWDPIRLFDQSAVEDRFGPALTSSGTVIDSQVSYAAAIAFENGAPSVVVQPLFVRATPGDHTSARSQPNATQAATANTWSDSLNVLRNIEDVNIIVPIVGQSNANVGDATMLSIMQTIQDHVQFMKQSDQFIIGLFGEDSSASNTVAQKITLRNHAVTLAGRYGGILAQQTVIVGPTKFQRALPVFGQNLFLGGQYVAAGVGGMIASRPVSQSLTRKVLSGFNEVSDPRTRQEKDEDAANGLLVIEQKSGLITVRHAVTTDTTGAAKRELSVVRAKHRMIESIRDTLDRQIIGNLIADQNAPLIVASAIEGVLAELLQQRDIVDFTPVNARLLSLEPTTIQAKFSYRPAFPVNYIDIEFSIDMTNQSVTDATL